MKFCNRAIGVHPNFSHRAAARRPAGHETREVGLRSGIITVRM